MKKIILFGVFVVSCGSVFANDINQASESNIYKSFQQFDRQYNVGIGATSGQVYNGSTGGLYSNEFLSMEVERLFDVGVWMDVSAYLNTYYTQPDDPAVIEVGMTTGSQAQFGGINAKVGYAFPLIKNTLLITPYMLVGRNVNLSSYTLSSAPSTANLTQDYFWTIGGGGRLEYRIDDTYDIYLDQSAAYNASQAPTTQGFAANNNYQYTTTFGAKFNVYKKLQLGAQTFYTNSYYTNSLTTINGQSYVPTNSFGGMATIGLTY